MKVNTLDDDRPSLTRRQLLGLAALTGPSYNSTNDSNNAQIFVFRAGMRPEDPKDRNPRNSDNGSNLNWRGIFLFVVYTSVVLGFFLFSRNGNYRSVDGPAPGLSYDDRNRGPEGDR